LVAVLFFCIVQYGACKREVLPWMCLERCGDNSTTIGWQLKSIHSNRNILSGVSFEMFNLGANSSLILNNLTRVHKEISSFGLQTFAMVSSWPYPPQFLDWMRQLFANPQPFITACLDAAHKYNLSGFDVDFEPTSPNATALDAQRFADFLGTFTSAMHAVGKQVHVDVGSWSAIWNFTLLGQCGVDRVTTMTTYTNDTAVWQKTFAYAVQQIPAYHLGIGLETLLLTNDTLQYRFDSILKYNLTYVGIWDMPIPSWWWPHIELFVNS